MRKLFLLMVLVVMPIALTACSTKCETEPVVAENHKLIVPPNFGAMPK